MSKKKFTLDHAFMSITLEVDTEQFAPVAKEINDLWFDSAYRLNKADGCQMKAALLTVVGGLCRRITEGHTESGAVADLSEEEGVPENLHEMIKVVDHDLPAFDYTQWEVREGEA